MGKAARESIREAVEVCGADRVGHGLAAADDPLLLAMLAAREIFVELCPGSNVLTRGIKTFGDFPLAAFLDAGVPCGLNTDDRTMFNVTLNETYEQAHELLGLTDEVSAEMQKAATRAAFASVSD